MGPVLVTGAAGFLGSTVCRQLVEAGLPVRAYLRPGTAHPTLDALPVERHWGDINDAVALRRALHGCFSVVHTVVLGRYSRRYWNALHRINAQGTRSVLEAAVAAGAGQAVLLDTISAFPAARDSAVRVPDFGIEAAGLSRYPYLHSKHEARRIADAFRDALRVVSLYCSPLYGAGDKHNHTGVIFQALQRHRFALAPPGGTSVVCVEDAARACVLAATRTQASTRLVVSSEHWSFRALYDRIASSVRPDAGIRWTIPSCCFYPGIAAATLLDRLGSGSQFTPYLVRNGFRFRCFDATDTQRRLGWTPRIAIGDAIDMQTDWMRRHGHLAAG